MRQSRNPPKNFLFLALIVVIVSFSAAFWATSPSIAGNPATLDSPEDTYSISGVITDLFGQPVRRMSIYLNGEDSGVDTMDATGRYTLNYLQPGTYTVSARFGGMTVTPVQRTVTIGPSKDDVNFVVSRIDVGLRPYPHGYSFSNGDGWWSIGALTDFTQADMIRMFGASAVCVSGNGDFCITRPTAQIWRDLATTYWLLGHCEGMAATSIRFYMGADDVSDLKSGAEYPYELSIWDARRHIAYYFYKQFSDPVNRAGESSFSLSTMDVTKAVARNLLKFPTEMVTIWMQSIQLFGDWLGHSVTPYAIEQVESGVFRILVYDNNYPGDTSNYIQIAQSSNAWEYYHQGKMIYNGGPSSGRKLGYVHQSAYAAPSICPWCGGGGVVSQAETDAGISQVWYQGGGHLLITNSEGKRLGYADGAFVNEIEGAFPQPVMLGEEISAEPIYNLPITDTYSIVVDGSVLTQTTGAGLTQFGPGFSAGLENLLLEPGQTGNLQISPDGTSLAYSSDEGDSADLVLNQENEDVSRVIRWQGVDLSASESVTLTMDAGTGQVAFQNHAGAAGVYDLVWLNLTLDQTQLFRHTEIPIFPGDIQYLETLGWDGIEPLTLLVDSGADGTIDETLLLENQSASVFLPFVSY